jgi:hypothetical protein
MNTFAKIPIGVISQSFGPAAWMRLMEDILGNPISSNMDLIDIAWEGFGALFERIDQREGMVIKMRYADELTLKETGKRIGRKNNPKHLITAEVVRQIQLIEILVILSLQGHRHLLNHVQFLLACQLNN